MIKFRNLFSQKCAVIGMVHVGALPGTPKYKGSIDELIETACKEAEIYGNCKVDGIMVENMHDIPYVRAKDFGPEIVSSMTRICSEVKKVLPAKTPCGVQLLAGGNMEALAVAHASGFNFIRAEGFVFAHVADEGLIEACAGPLLRYRHSMQFDDIIIFSDIKKKHSSHSVTNDVDIVETAKAAEFFLSDGIIITGSSTGSPADVKQLIDVKKSVNIPVFIGSGVTLENLDKYKCANGVIIGSFFKNLGRWQETVSKDKVMTFMQEIFKMRESLT